MIDSEILKKHINNHIEILNKAIKLIGIYDDAYKKQYILEMEFYKELYRYLQKKDLFSDSLNEKLYKKMIFYKENMNKNQHFIRRYILTRIIYKYNMRYKKEIDNIPF